MVRKKSGKFDQKAMDRITDKVLAFRPKKEQGKGKGEEADQQSKRGR